MVLLNASSLLSSRFFLILIVFLFLNYVFLYSEKGCLIVFLMVALLSSFSSQLESLIVMAYYFLKMLALFKYVEVLYFAIGCAYGDGP